MPARARVKYRPIDGYGRTPVPVREDGQSRPVSTVGPGTVK